MGGISAQNINLLRIQPPTWCQSALKYGLLLLSPSASTYKGGIKQLAPTQTISCSLPKVSLPTLVTKVHVEQTNSKHMVFWSLTLVVVTGFVE